MLMIGAQQIHVEFNFFGPEVWLSSRVLALQEQSPEFKSQSCQKMKFNSCQIVGCYLPT
jgi:hypothetical protein